MNQESAAPALLGPAEYIVIGGGAMGCGAAYALAKAGHADVLVLDKQPNLCEVTSSQGAGLCGQVRSSVERTRLAMFSARTFAELQAAGGPATPGWHPVGSLRLAHTEARAADLVRLETICRDAGLEVELLDDARARRLWPKLTFAGIRGALWCPSDGYMHPQSVVATYVHHARESGVRFATNVVVQGIELRHGRVAAVRTNRGTIECGNVVNAAGAHAYHVARMVGLELPIVPVRHEYFVSVPMPGLHPELPVVRIPDIGLYLRADGQGVLAGGFEDDPCSQNPTDFGVADEPVVPGVEAVAGDFARRLEPLLPGVSGLPVTRFAKGWPTFTPDGRFIVGRSSRVPGFIMAGGCQAHGISGSPGLGRHLVEALFGDDVSPYVRSLSPDRFEEHPWDWPTARRAAEQVYREYYAIGP